MNEQNPEMPNEMSKEKAIEVLQNSLYGENGFIFEMCNANALNKACKLAIKIMSEQNNNGWIPVSIRLPSEKECHKYDVDHPLYRKFLCTIKIGKYDIQTRELFFSKVFGWKYGPEDYNTYVIAWQPLPAPYKEKKGE